MFRALEYNVREDNQQVDYDQLESVARAERPKLIIAGASAYTREWDYARIRRVADEIGAIFLVDMGDFAAVNEVYGRRFTSHKPARSTVAVKSLPRGALVEIEVIANL